MYKVWRDKEDQVTKIVIDPWASRNSARTVETAEPIDVREERGAVVATDVRGAEPVT